MNPEKGTPGSLDDLDRHGVEFVRSHESGCGGLWLRCKKCDFQWAVRRGLTAYEYWTFCPACYESDFPSRP